MKKHIRPATKIIALALSALFLANANAVHAEDNCVTQYGGSVVCGSRTPEESHAPVKAGLGDINFGLVGAALVASSAALYIYGKKQTNSSQASV